MTEAQQSTLNAVIGLAKADPTIRAVILCGSLAAGTEKPESDVDVFVVVTDPEIERRKPAHDWFWGTDASLAEFGVHVDGKVISRDFLERLPAEGNEAILSTLAHARVIHSIDDTIPPLVSRSVAISSETRLETIRRLYALMVSKRFTATDDPSNILQVKFSILETVFYACRLILAHNNVLYPCLKHLEREVRLCREMPEDFIPLMHRVLEEQSFAALDSFWVPVDKFFRRYRYDDSIRKGYVLENEQFWFHGLPPVREL